MSDETVDPPTLVWAAAVWSKLSAVECTGVLYIAVHYTNIQPGAYSDYIDRMSLLPWLSLGEPLQRDVARALVSLRRQLAS